MHFLFTVCTHPLEIWPSDGTLQLPVAMGASSLEVGFSNSAADGDRSASLRDSHVHHLLSNTIGFLLETITGLIDTELGLQDCALRSLISRGSGEFPLPIPFEARDRQR